MGTNYYLHSDPCPHCGRSDEPVHIGKSSCGWCFSLHVTNDIHSLDDWMKVWAKPGRFILDEYGERITKATMLRIITRAGLTNAVRWHKEELIANHAVRGPKGLARALMDGKHCVGHGDGAWDLIAGEFS